MKLFHMPNSCSLGIYVLIEETKGDFQIHKIDLASQEQHSEEYRAKNPKSKVPTLELEDGALLTEWPAIAYYLAAQYPAAKLMPTDVLQQTRILEATDYIVSTIHMQGFTRIARPENFTFSENEYEQVRQRGREIMERGFEVLAEQIKGPYLFGEFSFADAALFYVEHWAVNRANMALPEKCRNHLVKMLERPSVKKMIEHDQIPLSA